MAAKIIKSFYEDSVEVIFYPDSHRYRREGEKKYLVSVTGATDVLDKSQGLMKWAVALTCSHLLQHIENDGQLTADALIAAVEEARVIHKVRKEEAAGFGDMVHDYAERFAQAKMNGGEMPPLPEGAPEPVVHGIRAFLAWYNENDVEFLETEKLVYSKEHDFVGTLDGLMRVNGKYTLADYKTSKGIYPAHYAQLGGYDIALREMGIEVEQNMILHFNKENGNFDAIAIDDEDRDNHRAAFLHCLGAKKWLKQYSKWED